MRRKPVSLLLGCVLASFATTASVAAPPLSPPLPPVVPKDAEPLLPPYQDGLERLAEILGTLAYMQTLCGPQGGPDWREKMTDLLGAEAATEQRRARLAGRFNRGYESYRVTYRTCTPAARTVIARLLSEGERLSGSLSRQFTID